jgi:hypothetical protein
MGMAQKMGKRSSRRSVRPGPDQLTMSSMPKAPDDTKTKIMTTAVEIEIRTRRSWLAMSPLGRTEPSRHPRHPCFHAAGPSRQCTLLIKVVRP